MGFITSQSLSCFFSPWDVSHKRKSTQGKNRTLAEELCHRFSLDEIIAATHRFDHNLRIGQGSVGTVYKGYVKVPRYQIQVVAIKRFSPSSGAHEFREEVQLLCQLRHPNIISLIGFCEEKGERILVYEYMPNGTLSNYLHSRIGSVHPEGPLLWKQRLEICIALAAAIHHLHTGVKYAIVHRNMSCRDILLDERLVPKLSGFHFYVRGPPSLSNTLLIKKLDVVRGTTGYIDPELFFRSGKLTEKTDVYSFGVVLTEVLCRNLGLILTEYDESSTVHDIIDPFLVGRVAPECLKKFINIAARCKRATGAERPTMGEVQVELQYALALQESADADKERDTCTSGGDYTYNDETSFSEIHDIFCSGKYAVPLTVDDVSSLSPNTLSFSSCDDEGR